MEFEVTRSVYHVVPDDWDWRVTKGGVTLSRHANKDDAVVAATREAKANEPSQLVIHKRDGTIEKEYTYGDDPYPPPG